MTLFTQILLKRAAKQKKYFLQPLPYAKKIKKVALRFFPKIKILLFGSAVKNQALPGGDIDVLIICEKLPSSALTRSKIKTKIYQALGFSSPFEIHLVDEKEARWYQRFIKNDYLLIS